MNEFFYCFLYKWLFMNLSRAVTFEHTFLIPEDTKSAVVLESFQRLWKKEHRKCPEETLTFLHQLIQLFYKPWILAQFFYLGWCVSAGLQPQLLKAVVVFLQDPIATNEAGFFGIFIVRLWYSVYVLHQLEVSYSSSHRCSRPTTHYQSSPSKSLAFTPLL